MNENHLCQDLGSAMLIALVAGLLLFIAGARWLHLLGGALAAAPVLYAMIFAVPWRYDEEASRWR